MYSLTAVSVDDIGSVVLIHNLLYSPTVRLTSDNFASVSDKPTRRDNMGEMQEIYILENMLFCHRSIIYAKTILSVTGRYEYVTATVTHNLHAYSLARSGPEYDTLLITYRQHNSQPVQ